ncbi:hypothetical protein R6Q59_009840 [Mikania micrantha]
MCVSSVCGLWNRSAALPKLYISSRPSAEAGTVVLVRYVSAGGNAVHLDSSVLWVMGWWRCGWVDLDGGTLDDSLHEEGLEGGERADDRAEDAGDEEGTEDGYG